MLASPDIEYSDAAAQARIAEAVAAVGASEFVDGGSVDSWLTSFLAEAAPTAAGFYPALRAWLATPGGRRFVDDVELVDDAACTRACVVTSRIDFTQSKAQWGNAFPVYVEAVAVTEPFGDLDARLFADEYIVYELDEYNKLAAKIAVLVGTGGITVALLLFFHPLIALGTALSIFCIELMTVPFIVLAGIRSARGRTSKAPVRSHALRPRRVVHCGSRPTRSPRARAVGPAVVFSSAAAFGLASDAIVHVIHAWHEALEAGSDEPIKVALALVGHPLLFSGLSTSGMFVSFLPIIYPPIASIQMAYTLSLTFLAFTAVQLFFGLLLVPSVLSFFSPDAAAAPKTLV